MWTVQCGSQSNENWRADRLSKNLDFFIKQEHMHLERFLGFLAPKSIKLFCKPLLLSPYPFNMVHFTPFEAKKFYILVNQMFSWL